MSYKWKHRPIVFNGDRVKPSGLTIEFPSHEEFEKWFKRVTVGLAELDQAMNYCVYFERTNGNIGNYVREGKSFPVNGTWTGYEMNCDFMIPFRNFLEQNGWKDDWFKLRDKYARLLEI